MVFKYQAGGLSTDSALKPVKFKVFHEAAYGAFIDHLLAHFAEWYKTVYFLPAGDEDFADFLINLLDISSIFS